MVKLSSAGGTLAEELVRNQKMLMWEGATLMLSLFLGAAALLYFVIRDRRQSEQLMQFFLAFSHELKTPIATVRLYAETLTSKLKGAENIMLGKELMREADRLSLQLENSLALAQIQEARLYSEKLSLKELIRPLRAEFEKLSIHLTEDAEVIADSQALTTILRNLLRNASIHGKATEIRIAPENNDLSRVIITFSDNGKGLQGDRSLLGKKFQRLYRGSGTGIGLYLSKELADKMGGELAFPSTPEGFHVTLELSRGELGT